MQVQKDRLDEWPSRAAGGPKHESSWLLAQLRPNCHHIAERNLERQGFHIFLPMVEETRTRAGKFVPRLHPLFPGYVFVGGEVESGAWRAINSTYGVTRLVSFGSEPAFVPAELVSELMLRCDRDGVFSPLHRLNLGDQVKITTGPFADFVATVEEIESDKRVWVLVELLGRTTRVSVTRRAVNAL